jgi:hypothetical protein
MGVWEYGSMGVWECGRDYQLLSSTPGSIKKALGPTLYALRLMPYALRLTSYASCLTPYALRFFSLNCVE